MTRRLAALMLLTGVMGCTASGPRPLAPLTPGPTAIHDLAAVFAEAGLTVRVFDDTSLILSREGFNVVVFVENAGGSLQAVFSCVWRGSGDFQARVATWNSTRRFSRAYLDADGRPVLASDLALDGTVSRHSVAEWGRLLLDMAEVFVVEVWPSGPSTSEPINE